MDINELIEKKTILEEAVTKLIEVFEKETFCKINILNIKRIDITEIGKPQKYLYSTIAEIVL